ncbi:Crp/Fnr family transcriptional regulator [Castellaniella sp.]|uniref:Crp/Fnr family transcriptional regulator n=1 Tax=Castellaniella sp. TaxID=1955812 RepID=UPI00355CD261
MAKHSNVSSHRLAAETWLPQSPQASYLASLRHLATTIEVAAGDSLFDQGQIDKSFYVVLSGKIHVSTISEHGSEAILNIMGPGSVIGEAAAFLLKPRFSRTRAVVDSTLLRFESDQIRRFIIEDPDFAMALLYLLSIKQRQMVERLRQAIFDTPERRILDFLRQFYFTHQEEDTPDNAVAVNLTHEQIGNLTGLSRVTVTRILNRLKTEEILAFSGKRILLPAGFPDGPAFSTLR